MRQTNQGGSVLGFVVVGVILAALLVGGIYFVRQRAEVAVEPDTTTAPSPEETPAPERQEEEKPQQQPAAEQEKTERAEKPAEQPQNETLPGGGPQKEDSRQGSGQKSSHELPQTGPKEAVFSAAMLGLLAAVTLSYVRSRRQLASL